MRANLTVEQRAGFADRGDGLDFFFAAEGRRLVASQECLSDEWGLREDGFGEVDRPLHDRRSFVGRL